MDLSGNVLTGRLPKRALKLVQEWTTVYQDELLSNWKRGQQGQLLHKIPPLK